MVLDGIRLARLGLQVLGVDPRDVEPSLTPHRRVFQRLDRAQVRIVELDILADEGDVNRFVVVLLFHRLGPQLPQAGAPLHQVRGEGQLAQLKGRLHKLSQALGFEKQRHEVDCLHVLDHHDLLHVDLAVVGNLLNSALVQGPLAPTRHEVRVKTGASHTLDAVLGGLGLELAVDNRDEADVNVEKVAAPGAPAELRQGLDERHALDISDRPTQLDDAGIRLLARIVDRDPSNSFDPVLDGIGDMWHSVHTVSRSFKMFEIRAHTLGRFCPDSHPAAPFQ